MLGYAKLADKRGAAFAGWPRSWIPAFAGMTFRVADPPGFVCCDSLERGDLEQD